MFVESNVRFQSLELLPKALKLYKRVGYGAVIITFEHSQFFSLLTTQQKDSLQNQSNRPRGRKTAALSQEQQAVSEQKRNCDGVNENNLFKKEHEHHTELKRQLINNDENEKERNDADKDLDSDYDKAYEQTRKGLFGIEGLLKKYSFALPDQLSTIDIFQQIQALCKAENLPFALRVNVESNNQETLKKELAKLDKFDVLVSVTTTDKDCLVLASKDSRVDIVSFINPQQIESAFKGAISQCYHSEKTIEIGFEPLILEKHANRGKMMRTYQKFFNLCRFPRDRIIATNAATQWLGIRGPKELMAVVIVVFHIAEPHAKRLFREHQEMILSRYYLLLGHQLGEMGVKIHEGMPDLEEYDNKAKETMLNLNKEADRAENNKENKQEAENK